MHVGCLLSEQVENLVKASSSVLVSPDNITLILSVADISVKGKWSYNFAKWFFSFSDSGCFEVSLSGVSISLSVSLGLDTSGHLTIWSTSCSCSISSISISSRGGASWLYTVYAGFVKEPILIQLQTNLCEAAATVINGSVNDRLTSFPLQMTVFSDWLFDYSFLSAPNLQDGFLDTQHKATFSYKGNTTESPILVRNLRATGYFMYVANVTIRQ